MSEGARKGSSFVVVCTSPDVCLTPLGPIMVPVPYQIVGLVDEACMASHDVKFAGEPAVLADRSVVMRVVGNEAGVGGGIRSGQNRWIVEFDRGSGTVHVNGQQVVRHGDECWMNGRNTRGKVICTDGMGPACSIVNGRPTAPRGIRGAAGTAAVNILGAPAPVKPAVGPQAAALKRAAVMGSPFCEP